jgi:hypothetical protein
MLFSTCTVEFYCKKWTFCWGKNFFCPKTKSLCIFIIDYDTLINVWLEHFLSKCFLRPVGDKTCWKIVEVRLGKNFFFQKNKKFGYVFNRLWHADQRLTETLSAKMLPSTCGSRNSGSIGRFGWEKNFFLRKTKSLGIFIIDYDTLINVWSEHFPPKCSLGPLGPIQRSKVTFFQLF